MPGVVALKSLADGKALKTYLNAHHVQKVVILGMGYIGLEMAEALCARGLGVEMVKPGPDLLPWMPRELAAEVERELENHGVGLHAGQEIQAITRQGEGYMVVCQHRRLSTEMVLVAAGITPNSEAAAKAGIGLGAGGAVAVNRRLQTSDRAVYAAGDCADAFHVVTGE